MSELLVLLVNRTTVIVNMKNIKRSTRKLGKILGHQQGLNSKALLTYLEARIKIYLPLDEFVLKNYLLKLIIEISETLKTKNVILLDYETNCDIYNIKKPLSHAFLIKNYILTNFQI